MLNWIANLFNPIKTRRRAKDRQLFYGLTAYSWSARSTSERRQLINALVEYGWTGIHIELQERYAWWPRAEAPNDYIKYLRPKVDALVPWIEDTDRAGLWLYVVDCNSNSDMNRHLTSAGPLIVISDYLTSKAKNYGHVIRLPVSEQDSDLKSDIRTAYIHHVERTWPKLQTSSMSGFRPDTAWTEYHQKSITRPAPGGGSRSLAVSDTGQILIELCGSVTGPKIDHDKAIAWANKMLTAGNSASLYALGTGIDIPLIKKAENITRSL